ncbi:TetR/AcrR family transcriptional regulator [Nocardioides guangzhouensis]|nr:TetR/AcrR family transcriptional regulator [Nocardioides guangzhouensis]
MSTADADGTRRRAQLTRPAILEAATRLAAEGRPLTFRSLGTALDADPTAVYRHFRDKEDLVCGVLDRLLVEAEGQVDLSGSWREQIHQLAELTWGVCARYPSVCAEVHVLTTGGPGETACMELVLERLQDAGLDPQDAVRFYAVVSSFIVSVGSSVAVERLRVAAGSPRTSWTGELGKVDAQQFPVVAGLRGDLMALEDRAVHRMGIEVILDAAAAAARPSSSGRS